MIVTGKAPALPAVAAGSGPPLSPKTIVVFAMNGIPWWYLLLHGGENEGRRLERIDPGDALRRAIAGERVVGGVLYCGSENLEPGVIRVETPKGRLQFGTPDGRSLPDLDALAAARQMPDFTVEIVPEIRKTIWSKVTQNICSGLRGCLTGATPKSTYADPTCADAEKLPAVQRNQAHVSSIIRELLKSRMMEFRHAGRARPPERRGDPDPRPAVRPGEDRGAGSGLLRGLAALRRSANLPRAGWRLG